MLIQDLPTIINQMCADKELSEKEAMTKLLLECLPIDPAHIYPDNKVTVELMLDWLHNVALEAVSVGK